MSKKIQIIALSFAFIAGANNNAYSQVIPNGTFETWQMKSGNEVLSNGWLVSDEVGITCTPKTATKSTDKTEGSFALLLQTGNCIEAGGAHEGFASIRFPVNAKPDSLRFKYKLDHTGTDTASISLKLTKWAAGTGTTELATLKYPMKGTQSTYKTVTIAIPYKVSSTPDSARIEISSDGYMNPKIGNKLWMDELQFVKATSTDVASITNHVSNVYAYPVPAGNNVAIGYTLNTPNSLSIRLFDVTGKLVKEENVNAKSGRNETTIDINNLTTGFYFYSIWANNTAIATGRFTKQ